MQERFLNLPKIWRIVILIIMWVVSFASFAGCLLVKHFLTIEWLEIVFTCIGMLLSIMALCMTLSVIFANSKNNEITLETSEENEENND